MKFAAPICLALCACATAFDSDTAKQLAELAAKREKVEAQMGTLAKTVSEMEADKIPVKSATMKAFAETVLATAIKHLENRKEIEETFADVSQNMKAVLKSHTEMDIAKQAILRDEYTKITTIAKEDIYSRQENAASQVVFSIKQSGAKDMDANADGKINKEELMAQLKVSYAKVERLEQMKILKDSKGHLKTIIDILDKNLDGLLSKAEFEGTVPDAETTRVFEFLDHNKNGELDLDEFFLLAFPEFHPDHDKSAEFMAHDMYLKCSPDAKGDISLQGMVKAYVGTQLAGKDCKTEECSTAEQSRYTEISKDANAEVKELIAIFKETDKDGDSKVSKADFLTMVEKVTTRLDIADVAGKLIKAIDSNGDGSISYDEVIKHAEVFGGETKDFYKDTDVLFIKGMGVHAGLKLRSSFTREGVNHVQGAVSPVAEGAV